MSCFIIGCLQYTVNTSYSLTAELIDTMKQLNIQDAGFIYQETEHTKMHIAGLGLYDQSSSKCSRMNSEQLYTYIGERLHHSPILKKKLKFVSADWLRPYWVDDAEFDISRHVQHVRLPEPGDLEQLMAYVSQEMSESLDMAQPLWQVYVIEGLNGVEGMGKDSFAVLAKVHHSCIDGVTSASVLAALNDLSPDASVSAPVEQEIDDEESRPGVYETISRDYAQNIINAYRQSVLMSRKVPAIAKMAFELYRGRKDSGAKFAVPPTRFNQTPYKARKIDYISFELAQVKAIKNAYQGVTVNDVMICIISGALRRYLDHYGELSDVSLGAAIPKNIRTAEDDADTHGNKVGGLFSSIHTDIADPIERLYAIQFSMQKAKAFAEEVDTGELFPAMMGGFLSPRAGKAFAKFCQRYQVMERIGPVVLNTLITNVPGPNFPLYHGGAKMVNYAAMLPLTDGVSLGHAVFSYCDKITLSVITCPELMDDVDFYLQCCEDTFQELILASKMTDQQADK